MAYLAEQVREVRKRIADRRLAAEEAAEERRREVAVKEEAHCCTKGRCAVTDTPQYLYMVICPAGSWVRA